jgi:hypothetical protein
MPLRDFDVYRDGSSQSQRLLQTTPPMESQLDVAAISFLPDWGWMAANLLDVGSLRRRKHPGNRDKTKSHEGYNRQVYRAFLGLTCGPSPHRMRREMAALPRPVGHSDGLGPRRHRGLVRHSCPTVKRAGGVLFRVEVGYKEAVLGGAESANWQACFRSSLRRDWGNWILETR